MMANLMYQLYLTFTVVSLNTWLKTCIHVQYSITAHIFWLLEITFHNCQVLSETFLARLQKSLVTLWDFEVTFHDSTIALENFPATFLDIHGTCWLLSWNWLCAIKNWIVLCGNLQLSIFKEITRDFPKTYQLIFRTYQIWFLEVSQHFLGILNIQGTYRVIAHLLLSQFKF